MHDIVLLFILLCIIYYLFFQSSVENYETNIVAYNNTTIPTYYTPSVFETETNELTKLFKELSKDNDFNTSKYSIQNPYIPFPFTNHIKKFIIEYLKNNVSKFKKDKFEITSDLNEIYWLDKDNDRIFIFDVNLINNTQFMSRNIIVKIIIKNIKNFLKGQNEYLVDPKNALTDYKTNVPMNIMLNSVELLGIKLGRNDTILLSIQGIDALDLSYYQIKNRLHLMDPFITSGKDMIITPEMKKDFQKNIEEHQSLLNILSGKKKA